MFEGGKAIVSAEAVIHSENMLGGGSGKQRRRFPRSQGVPLGLYRSKQVITNTWQGGSMDVASCSDDVFEGFFN